MYGLENKKLWIAQMEYNDAKNKTKKPLIVVHSSMHCLKE